MVECARAHVYRENDPLVSPCYLTEQIVDWSAFLREDEEAMAGKIEKCMRTGRPLGTEGFIEKLESTLERTLKKQKPGPKPVLMMN